MREKDQLENTPLHFAARMGRTEVTRFLVERWPEGKKALNYHRETPLSMFEKQARSILRLIAPECEDEEAAGVLALWG
jgi:hypothetical protein